MKYISPLRYPGGKTQLYNFIKETIENQSIDTFCELCGGGANLALSLLYNHVVTNILINDYDKGIYSLFYNILYNPQLLISKIEKVPFDIHDDYQPLFLNYYNNTKKHYFDNISFYSNTDINLAFEYLFLNRCNYSGIINSRPIGGIEQTGKYKLNCRFNKQTLIKKIHVIHSMKEYIALLNEDINTTLKTRAFNKKSLLFIDPPYVKQGNNLYNVGFTKKQHQQLASLINQLQTPYIITYDDNELIKSLYPHKNTLQYTLKYSSNNQNKGKHFELMIVNPKLKTQILKTNCLQLI